MTALIYAVQFLQQLKIVNQCYFITIHTVWCIYGQDLLGGARLCKIKYKTSKKQHKPKTP